MIGGGIAGLLAARVLINHFEQVTLIERDHYPADPSFRGGVPQARQVHTMLLRGQRALETVFPGLRTKLLKRGAIERDYGNESLYYYGARCPQLPSLPQLQGWNCSRLLLEWCIHQELAVYPQLHILEGYEVIHLLHEEHNIRGVQFRARNHRNPKENAVQEVRGDLVIDASGVTSPTSRWLEELGYQAPRETVVNSFLGYATRFYEIPTPLPHPWKNIAIQATQQHYRGGVLMAIEAQQWMVVLAGGGKDYPPTDEAAFLEFARSLPEQALYEAIKNARPLSPIYGYRRTENRRRHFEAMSLQPEGFAVLGDAICTLNPLYGQGMTLAVLEALMLDRCLSVSKSEKGFARSLQRKLARLIDFPWKLATAADGRHAHMNVTKGWSQHYTEHLMALLPHDPVVLRTFLEVIHMLKSPIALLHPLIVAKVMVHADWL